MTTLLILFLISFVGLAVVLGRGISRLKAIPKEEFLPRYNETKPFWSDFYELVVVPASRVHQEKVRPKVYKEIEKLARRFRIIVLRIECLLLRFSEYIRGKRVMPPNGMNGRKSHYWEQLNNCKNGVNGNGETPP